MKGETTLKVTQATMIEALQLYFDGQFSENKHKVMSVKSASNSAGYGANSDF